jgi:hypothetical protein
MRLCDTGISYRELWRKFKPIPCRSISMQPLPAPAACAMFGAFAGLLGGGCAQCFPVWVGGASGAGLGCIICLVQCSMESPGPPVAKIASQPVVVQNIYVTYEVSGVPKDAIKN